MRLLILTYFIFLSLALSAQTGVVRGEVFDDNGLLPGVDISVSEISTSISTDADGAFAIKLKPGEYDFVFRFPQYNNEKRVVKIKVSEIEDIEVEMKLEDFKDESQLQENNKETELQQILQTGQAMFLFIKQMVLRIK